jgi:release factor glutamine methyltransferase
MSATPAPGDGQAASEDREQTQDLMEAARRSRGMALLERHLDDPDRPAEFTLLGQSWDLLDGVFCPAYTPVTELFSAWLPYPVGGTFLEMGSGAGVTAVLALQAGCRLACALDISAAAVENTRRNAIRHGVADRLRVQRSDMFAALDEAGDDAAPQFDMIYWNSNFTEVPAEFVNETDLHHAFFDPAYAAHRRYLREAPRHLAPGGRLMLGFASIGNVSLLRQACQQAGLELEEFRAQTRELEVTLEFQLLEFRPANGRSWHDIAAGE